MAFTLSFYLENIIFLVISAFSSFLFLILSQKKFLSQYRPFGGWANWITFSRLLLLLGVSFFHYLLSPLSLFFSFGAVIMLDVIDGAIARKKNLQSDFGLYFDMETDALFVLLVAFVLYTENMIPVWVFIPGLLRYINVAIYSIFRLPAKKEPKRKYASYIAGFLFLALILPFIIPANFSIPILAIASIAVIFSFIISFIQYLKADPL